MHLKQKATNQTILCQQIYIYNITKSLTISMTDYIFILPNLAAQPRVWRLSLTSLLSVHQDVIFPTKF